VPVDLLLDRLHLRDCRWKTKISLSLLSDPILQPARLLERSCALTSSVLTPALESGELQFGVLKSTWPWLMLTATLGRFVAFRIVFFDGDERIRLHRV